jgi:hypothetical protein
MLSKSSRLQNAPSVGVAPPAAPQVIASAAISPPSGIKRQLAAVTLGCRDGGGHHRRSLGTLLKSCGLLPLVFGSGVVFSQNLGSSEKVGAPAGTTGHVTTEIATPEPSFELPRAASTDTMTKPSRMVGNSEPASDTFTGHSGVVLLGANVRADPHADAPVLRMVGSGVYVRVFARRSGWLQVGHSKPWGWVHISRTEDLVGTPSFDQRSATSMDITAEPPRMVRNGEPAPDASTGHSGVVLLGANVRADPSADASVLSTIGSGTQARVFARRGGWLQVGDSKPWGWVHVSRTRDLVGVPSSDPP